MNQMNIRAKLCKNVKRFYMNVSLGNAFYYFSFSEGKKSHELFISTKYLFFR